MTSKTEVVVSNYQKLYKTGNLSDATLRCGNKYFKVHRIILATQSEYFKRSFAGSFKEAQSKIINLKDHSQIAIKAMLQFIYVGQYTLPMNKDRAYARSHAEVYAAGEYFTIPALKEEALIQFGRAMDLSPQDGFSAARVIYTSTPDTDRKLRDLFIARVLGHSRTLFSHQKGAVDKQLNGMPSDIGLQLKSDLLDEFIGRRGYSTDTISPAKDNLLCTKCKEVTHGPRGPNDRARCPECWTLL